jgi:hypothetical protein
MTVRTSEMTIPEYLDHLEREWRMELLKSHVLYISLIAEELDRREVITEEERVYFRARVLAKVDAILEVL